jgi:acyl carrier protein
MENCSSWDSLKHMELIATIEEQFDVSLSFDEIVTMKSYTAIKAVLTEKRTG